MVIAISISALVIKSRNAPYIRNFSYKFHILFLSAMMMATILPILYGIDLTLESSTLCVFRQAYLLITMVYLLSALFTRAFKVAFIARNKRINKMKLTPTYILLCVIIPLVIILCLIIADNIISQSNSYLDEILERRSLVNLYFSIKCSFSMILYIILYF